MPFLFAALLAASSPQVPVDYYLSFENAAHREASITATFAALPDEPLVVRMARSSPGRYALHEFAKNIDDVWAVDSRGKKLTVRHDDPYEWVVEGHDGAVAFHYTLYADRADGTYSQVDTSHAHLNIPATLVWSEALTDRPVSVRIVPYAANWKVATQLEPTDHSYVFRAPDLAYLMDSPIEISDFDLREWQVTHKGETATIRMAVHHSGETWEVDKLEQRAKAIVDAHIALWDDIPDFDFGTYTFIADYLPWASGDGMEHRNSTILTASSTLEDGGFWQVGTVSHEFFHAWNAERLRPADLEPFDFTKADISQHLWLVEGFTNYYDGLLQYRAGDIEEEQFLSGMASLLNFTSLSPARPGSSPSEMSRNAPYMDAASSIDPDNFANSKLSYYTYGAAVGFGLDLEMRTRFGVSLDDYMRALWKKYGATAIPYTDADLVRTLADVTGDKDFAEHFFATVVHGDTLPDYQGLLAKFGYGFVNASPDKASFGPLSFDFEGESATISNNTVRGSPFYEAGLDRGDEILSVDGTAIASMEDWKKAIAALSPGAEVVIDWKRRDGQKGRSKVKAVVQPMLTISPYEAINEEQKALRGDWLGSTE